MTNLRRLVKPTRVNNQGGRCDDLPGFTLIGATVQPVATSQLTHPPTNQPGVMTICEGRGGGERCKYNGGLLPPPLVVGKRERRGRWQWQQINLRGREGGRTDTAIWSRENWF